MFLPLAWLYFTAFSLIKDVNEKVREMANDIKQHVLLKVKTNPKLLLVMCICFVEVFLNIGRTLAGDSHRYVHFSLFFLGKQPFLSDILHSEIVAMRPMVPLLASPLILILNNIYLSFGLVSGFFWIGGAVIAYKLGQVLLKDKDLAILVALSYTFAPPLLIYGAGVMTDSAGFFFIGVAVYLTLKREQQDKISSRTYFLDAFIVSFGVLFRETVLFALLFMLVRRFWKKRGFFETLLAVIIVGVFGLLFLHLLGIGPGIFVHKYLRATQVHTPSEDWAIVPYLSSLKGAYVTIITPPKPYFTSLTFWIWTLPALLSGLTTALGFIFSQRRKDLFLCLLLLFPSSVVWPAMRARFSFSMWPAILPAMISGLYFALSRLPHAKERTLSNPKIYIYFFILVMGAINTIETLTRYTSLTVASL